MCLFVFLYIFGFFLLVSYIESDYLEELYYRYLPDITPSLFRDITVLLHEKEVRINRIA